MKQIRNKSVCTSDKTGKIFDYLQIVMLVLMLLMGGQRAAASTPPTLTTFAGAVGGTNKDTEVEITLAELKAHGDEADSDGTVDAFVVKSVSTGTLKIGPNAGSATAYAATTNDTIDASNNAYWTPAASATGSQDAFAVVAEDDSGAESTGNVTAQVNVTMGTIVEWKQQSWNPSTSCPGQVTTSNYELTTNTTNPFYSSVEKNFFSAHDWSDGANTKYWEVNIPSTGFHSLTVSSEQQSENQSFDWQSGPEDFKLQYSLDGIAWNDIPGTTTSLTGNWDVSGQLNDIALPAECDDKSTVYLRWIMTTNEGIDGKSLGSTHQSQITNIIVEGAEIPLSPTDISLSNDTISASDPSGTPVGDLSAVDPNCFNTHSFSLVAGSGDTHNSSFQIVGNELQSNALLSPGTYSVRVNVNDGTYDYAKSLSITVTAYPAITGGTTQWGDYITNITFSGIDKDSENDEGYADYTSEVGTLMPGNSSELSCMIVIDDPTDYPAIVMVWFDWNQNYSFDDAGEAYTVGTELRTSGPHTTPIAVPSDAAVGNTRMRIVMDTADGTTTPPNSGSATFYGEAEDYTITVTGGSSNDAPVTGTVTANNVTQANAGQTNYTFTVEYTDSDDGIDVSSIDTNDVTINNSASITGASESTGSDGSPKTATYTLTPPGGSWDDSDNGTYTISLAGSQVCDTNSTPACVAANAALATFTVSMDTTAPTAPMVTGTTPTNDDTPTWSWIPGGGGNGNYRYELDDADLTSGATTTATTNFTPGSAINDGTHTLYVQERDGAGNWSSSGSFAIVVDSTAPTAPTVTGTTPTNDDTPTWSWTPGGGGNGNYRYELDDADLTSGATTTATTNFTPGSAISDGTHTLYVQERDEAGNWSTSGSYALVIDATAPTIAISAPSKTLTSTGPFTFTVTYAGADAVNLTNGNITLNKTLTANGTVNVTNGTTSSPTVTVSGTTGDGTLGISIAAGTASDTVGNTAPAAGPSATATIKNSVIYDLTVNNASITEGDTGSQTGSFSVERTSAGDFSSSVDFGIGGTLGGSEYNDVQVTGTGISYSAPTIIFGSTSTTATISINVLGDDVDEADETLIITLSNGTAAPTGSVMYSGNPGTTTIKDDDTAGITVSPTTGLVTSESGGTATFTVVLDSEPTANVTIGISSDDTNEGTVLPTSLNFTSGNWDTPQTVSITGVNDSPAVSDGNINYQIVTAATVSSDPNYNGKDPDDVSVINNDNDTPGFTFSPASGLITTEAGGTATFTVVLNTMPTATVTLPLSSGDTSEGTVSPASLIFTTTDWNNAAAHAVTVTGVNDDVDDDNVSYNIVTGNPISVDTDYDADDNPADVSASNTDDDTAGYDITAITGNTTEAGGTATFDINLNSEPTANVTIGFTSDDTTEGMVSPASYTFTSGDWSTGKTVTVTGVDDVIFDGDITFNIVTAADGVTGDGKYNGMNPDNLSVVNKDDDSQYIINEILADPDGDANNDGSTDPSQDEFVEIVNNSGADADISGWTLSDGTSARHTFPTGTVIPDGCAVLVFGGGTPAGLFGSVTVQTASTGTLDLDDAGDTVTLNDGSADVATYTYGAEGNDDQSLTRDPDISGVDPMVKHGTTAGGANYSPGTKSDGSSFAGCNSKPTASTIPTVEVNEDAPNSVINLHTYFDDGEDTDSELLYSVVSNSAPGLFDSYSISSTATTDQLILDYKADMYGDTISIVVRATDSGSLSVDATFSVVINPVNDRPSFTATNPTAVDQDSGAHTLAGWVTSFTPGATNESGQTAVYLVSDIGNSALFQSGPVVSADGSLSYTSAPGQFGSSSFKVSVRDSGGTTHGGEDTSLSQSFSITVNPVPEISVSAYPSGTEVLNGRGQVVASRLTNGSFKLVQYRIANIGTLVLELTPPVQISGPHAANLTVLQQPASSVAPGGTTDMVLMFSSTGDETQDAVVTIPNNDSDESPFSFKLVINPRYILWTK